MGTAAIIDLAPRGTQAAPPASSAQEDLVKNQLRNLSQQKIAYLPAPGRQIEVFAIDSWAQVALVLKRLDAKAEVRLTFPEPSAGPNFDRISQEQIAIHDFLSKRHNLSVQCTAALLVDKIAKSWLFGDLATDQAEKLADSWVKNQQLNPLKQDCISVSHVYTEAALTDPQAKSDLLAKLSAAPTEPKVIFEVPIDPSPANAAALKTIAEQFKKDVASAPITADCQVWVGDPKTTTPSKCLAFKPADFVDHYVDGKPAVTIPPVGAPPDPTAEKGWWRGTKNFLWHLSLPVRKMDAFFAWIAGDPR